MPAPLLPAHGPQPTSGRRGGRRRGSGAKPGNTNSLKNGLYSGRVRALTLALQNMPQSLASIRAADRKQIIVLAQALHQYALVALLVCGLDPSILQLRLVSSPATKKTQKSEIDQTHCPLDTPPPTLLPCLQ